jgi:hypothetical protein
MAKQEEKGRLTRKVTVRFTEEEYKTLNASFKNTTKRKLSSYIRAVLMHKPITVYTRNKSFDDFVAEMMLLRTELKAIGNNFNQSVKKLHTMDKDSEVKTWALLNENSKQIFLKKVDEINSKIIQIDSKWSQE